MFARHKESLYEELVFPCRITAASNRGRLVFDGSDTRGAAGGTWLNEREAKAVHWCKKTACDQAVFFVMISKIICDINYNLKNFAEVYAILDL